MSLSMDLTSHMLIEERPVVFIWLSSFSFKQCDVFTWEINYKLSTM